jgi:hypothetical protein
MRKRYRKILVTAALTALALTAIFASAANAEKPTPRFEDFAGCPSPAEDNSVASCEKLEFTGGHISFGNRDVPITNTILMRGAYEQNTGNYLFNSEGGIIPVRQTVPGGVIGMTGLKGLDEFSEKALKLYAVVELAGQPGSIFNEASRFIPIKLHLEGPLLGKGCYIGSSTSPINLNLTYTTPIEEFFPEAGRPSVEVGKGGVFTDNTYAVPAASGCQLEIGGTKISIDSLVNAAYKLPAAAGTNHTVLDYNVSYAPQENVYP